MTTRRYRLKLATWTVVREPGAPSPRTLSSPMAVAELARDLLRDHDDSRSSPLLPRGPGSILVLYHGVLAPHARWRARVVAYGATRVSRPVPASPSAKVSASDDTATTPTPRHWAWADLMRRAFDIDVLACPRCGGRLRLIATLEDPDAIRAILAALAASRERDRKSVV